MLGRIAHSALRLAGTVVAAAAVTADLWAQNRAPLRPVDYGAVIAAIEQRVPPLMQQSNVPGLAIALVDGDSVVWAKGFGRTADSVPITDETLFSTQSISKTYTAAVVLRAAELGWLSLDDALIKYVPEFTVKSRFGRGRPPRSRFGTCFRIERACPMRRR